MVLIPHLDPGVIAIDANRYKLVGGVQKARANQFNPAQRTGNPERSDQQYTSEVIWDDLTGGMGVLNMDEREFPDRFSHSTLNTLAKKQLTPLPARTKLTLVGNAFTSEPVGACDYFSTTTTYTIVVGGTTMKRLTTVGGSIDTVSYLDTGTSTWVTTGGTEYALPAAATGRPIVWKGNVWIPCGTSGIARLDTSANTMATIADDTKFLAIFDEDLLRITTAGAIYSTDNNTTSPTWTSRGSIDTVGSVNGLAIHKNAVGDPAPVITTDRGIFILDYWAQKVYEFGIPFNDISADNGKAVGTWEGDLWFGKAGAVHQVLSGAKVNRGPANGEGFFERFAGTIADLDTSFDSFLLAAVDGKANNFSSILAYNKKGWHTLAISATGASSSVTTTYTDYMRVHENFQRTNGVDITQTPPVIYTNGGWARTDGTVDVASGTVHIHNSAAGILTIDMGIGSEYNYSVKAVLGKLQSSNSLARLIFRWSDGAQRNYNYVQRSAANSVTVVKVVANVSTTLATITVPAYKAGDTLAVTNYYVSSSDNGFHVYLNGKHLYSSTDTDNYTGQRAGLGCGHSDGSHFVNFEATSKKARITSLHRISTETNGFATPVIFNMDRDLHYIMVADITDNPAQYSPYSLVQGQGELITPWFDGGLSELQKTGIAIQARALNLNAGSTSLHSYKIYFQKDDDVAWTQAYTSAGAQSATTTDGVTTLYLDSATNHPGVKFYKIRFKVVLTVGAATQILVLPKIEFLKLRYLRELPVLYRYDFKLDLSGIQPDGRSSQEAIDDLEDAIEARQLVQIQYQYGQGTDLKTVLGLGYAGQMGTGTDKTMFPQLSCVEVV